MARIIPKDFNLNRLPALRRIIVWLKTGWYRGFWGIDIHPSCEMSLSAKLDVTAPKGVHIGEKTYLAFESRVLAHDFTRGVRLHTRIGKHCFIGGRSIILPGVTIGDGCIVGAGSVVTKSAPPYSVLAGNPARIIRENIDTIEYGRLREADANAQELIARGAFF